MNDRCAEWSVASGTPRTAHRSRDRGRWKSRSRSPRPAANARGRRTSTGARGSVTSSSRPVPCASYSASPRTGTLAGVSQASVSRFERGTAQGTPAIVMLKVAVALARQCRADDHTRLAEPLVRILDDIEELVPVRAVGELPMIARDPQAEQLQI